MLKDNPEYRRLKVDGYGLLGSASYWLGADHLLVVSTANYVENYQRFLYGDIQALLIRRSPMRLFWGALFSLLTISSILGAWAVRVGEAPGAFSREALYGMGALLGTALVFAALQTINLLRGPTCVCHLRTAVQTIPLPHLTRWRKAELLISELTPLALAKQEQAGPDAAPVAPAAPAPEETAATPATPEEETNLPPRISS